ncbi:hypothetical protein BKA93DRAFT_793537 [Sparassis latifolia]
MYLLNILRFSLGRVPEYMRAGAGKVINEDGTLLHIPLSSLHSTSIRECLLQHQVWIVTNEMDTVLDLAISFIEKCLVLDRSDRPSASELLQHLWLEGIQELRDQFLGRDQSDRV